jgi:selenocysteine-specific elongation factor
MRAIVGTAGHIDHGKSALVRALTGIETDRLPEERERGISIELGFAHLDLEAIGRAGVVDVPGHERFIRQMLAGAHGFDLVLVVVAADDGVMPQTEEHFDIVHLLGVPRAFFDVTKIDAVAASRVDDVRGEIEILAGGTRFEDAPVVAVSARTGEGLDELRRTIAAALKDLVPRSEEGLLRVPVDRVFVIKGHGLVVTGTALAGRVEVGDEVVVLPSGYSARVREVQVHGEAAPFASAGQRVALNLSGLAREDLVRGDTIAGVSAGRGTGQNVGRGAGAGSDRGTAAGSARGADAVAPADLVTSRFDARIEVRPAAGRALASHVRVRVHHGTREASARLVWLDGVGEVLPRQSGLAQLALAEPLVACVGDRFVIRDETASRTLGGGVVLLARAEKHRRSQGEVSPLLGLLEDGDALTRVDALLRMKPSFAATPTEAAAALGLGEAELVGLVEGETRVMALPDAKAPTVLLAGERARVFLDAVVSEVEDFQKASPNLPGVDLEHLRGTVRPVLDTKLFRLLVDRLIAERRLARRGNLVFTPAHAPTLGGADDVFARKLLTRLVGAGVMPPTVKELADELRVDAMRIQKVAGVLVERGELLRVTPELYFVRAIVEETGRRLGEHLRLEGEITAAGFRDLVSASRKYCIPLLDWFDRAGLTIRVGDVRRLRRT